MTPMGRGSFLVVLTAMLLTGCLEPGTQDDDEEEDAGPTVQERLLGPHPYPAPDGARVEDWLATFVADHPLRVTGSPNEAAATAHLVEALETLGYDVQVYSFPHPTASVPHERAHVLKTVVGVVPGTEHPDRWLAWGAHYDTATTTIEGAYDNGSGTALAMELARMLRDVETERSRAVMFFNGEEQGRQASEAFVAWYQTQDDFEIELYMGLDMVGIAHPAPGRPLAFFAGATHGVDLVLLAQEVAWDLLGLPDDRASVTFSDRNTRGSDEAHFEQAGIATIRFAGLQQNTDYWGYHRTNDTLETIHAMTGGPEHFQAGLANTASFAYGMLVAIDRHGVPAGA